MECLSYFFTFSSSGEQCSSSHSLVWTQKLHRILSSMLELSRATTENRIGCIAASSWNICMQLYRWLWDNTCARHRQRYYGINLSGLHSWGAFFSRYCIGLHFFRGREPNLLPRRYFSNDLIPFPAQSIRTHTRHSVRHSTFHRSNLLHDRERK